MDLNQITEKSDPLVLNSALDDTEQIGDIISKVSKKVKRVKKSIKGTSNYVSINLRRRHFAPIRRFRHFKTSKKF